MIVYGSENSRIWGFFPYERTYRQNLTPCKFQTAVQILAQPPDVNSPHLKDHNLTCYQDGATKPLFQIFSARTMRQCKVLAISQDEKLVKNVGFSYCHMSLSTKNKMNVAQICKALFTRYALPYCSFGEFCHNTPTNSLLL